MPDHDCTNQHDPYTLNQHKQHVDYLDLYVDKLPAREKTLIQLHYYDHLSFAEIANIMGVSRPRVTQLHGQAIKRIREWFTYIEEKGKSSHTGS